MTSDQSGDGIQTNSSLNRRRLLKASGVLGVTALVAGCGSPGPGADNESPATTNGMTTGSPTPDGGPTGTEAETPTETSTETETDGDARLRVAHLSPNAPNVDVYMDGSVVLEDVPFGAVSNYLDLAAGSHTVEITAAGNSETSVFEGDLDIDADTASTVAAIGELGDDVDQSFQLLVLTDNNDPPESGNARLRAVHASPDAPAVDITAGDTVLFDGVQFGGSGYVEVPAGEYTVEIRGDTPENDGDAVASFDVSLAAGQVYSAFAAGYLSPEDAPADTPFDLIVTQDTTA